MEGCGARGLDDVERRGGCEEEGGVLDLVLALRSPLDISMCDGRNSEKSLCYDDIWRRNPAMVPAVCQNGERY